ncbi:alanine--glyoxylate aminotransferase family protein [Aestuariibacter halophilus]|uniref:Alanine--glyoxylate aminotransferase family protein n=1 Tax=Fluctibacter halophilus TaxID=226011 RepID=A0ABS8G5F2_9ALTE|nr:alanine--glyoxylate aminotransferase family protein [Aestuariibacter halophilus]MCC2615724.1 alanine--glyoxylate aminotransferase family protein [Aestuariibacter halophilus]
MGPGPINCYPRVLRAMSTPLVGQYDPVMTGYMNETMALYRHVFETRNPATVLIDGTSRAGIEAILVSAIEPGDKVLVPIFGRFGYLLKEIAQRCGADVHCIDVPWGEVFSLQQIEQALRQVNPKLVAMVQGDTSTTMLQPLEGIGELCHQYGALLYVDATASVGGNPLKVDPWQIDAVSVGLQKCLGGPSGSAPITLSPQFVEQLMPRHHIEAGIRESGDHEGNGRRIASNYFDLPMILDYWGEKRLNHHTESATMLYSARECALTLLDEGIDHAIARHKLHGRAMAAGLDGLNLERFGDQQHKMNNIVAVYIPQGIDGEVFRSVLLNDFHIEIGTSFGPLHGKVWRIGTMGYNARQDTVFHTLMAMEAVLRRMGHPLTPTQAINNAYDIYASA